MAKLVWRVILDPATQLQPEQHPARCSNMRNMQECQENVPVRQHVIKHEAASASDIAVFIL